MQKITFTLCLLLAATTLSAQGTAGGSRDTIIGVGQIDQRAFEIGVTHIDTQLAWWSRAKDYYKGQVPFRNWKDRKAPLGWNHVAELVRDKDADLSTAWSRQCQARFVPGYRIMIQNGYTVRKAFSHLDNLELIFDQDLLISFTADVDSDFCKVMTYYNGPGKLTELKDTVVRNPPGTGKPGQLVLTQKRYSWQQGLFRAEVVIRESLDRKENVQRQSVLYVTDEARNAAYLKKVAAELRRLEQPFKQKS